MAMLIAWQTINAVRHPGSKTLHARISRRRAGPHDQGPPTRSPAERSRQLLRQPRTRPRRHAGRRQPREDRHHQLPRLQAPRANRTLRRRALLAPRARRGTEYPRNRRPDASAGDARPHGHEEHPRAQRRGAPLLPREAGGRGRRGSEGRREEGSREEQRGCPALDFRPGGRESQARPRPRHRSVGHAVLPARLRLRRGHAVPLDDERLLAHGRHRVRHRQTAARSRRRKHSRRRNARCYRNLWENIRKDMPKKGRGQGEELDPLKLPTRLQTALQALYGHYEKTFKLWEEKGIRVPPCFIIVCQNTAISKLVYDFISGFHRKNEDGTTTLENGRLALFRNFDETTGNPLPRPNTLLIDSEQLEAGDALDDNFRGMAADEIERFRREIVERTGDPRAGRKHHRSGTAARGHEHGRQARPTRRLHPLRGLRLHAHRGLGRQHGDARPRHPRLRHAAPVRAGHRTRPPPSVVRPERGGALQCRVCRRLRHSLRLHRQAGRRPAAAAARDDSGQGRTSGSRRSRNPLPARRRLPRRVAGGTPHRRIQRRFHPRSNPGPGRPIHHAKLRHHRRGRRPEPGTPRGHATVHAAVPRHPAPALHQVARPRRGAQAPPLRPTQAHHQAVARQLPRLQRRHLSRRSSCIRNWPTWPATASPPESREQFLGERPIKALLDPYNPTGSTRHVRFNTSKTDRWETSSARCHINWVILDSDWEAEFCRVAESHPKVRAYVKNHNLGLEVPYRYGSETRKYRPDFIVLVDDGHGDDDLLHLVVEIKGYRREDAKEKKSTMETYWVPGVNHLEHLRPLGVRRVHRRVRDRSRLQGQGRERIQQDD